MFTFDANENLELGMEVEHWSISDIGSELGPESEAELPQKYVIDLQLARQKRSEMIRLAKLDQINEEYDDADSNNESDDSEAEESDQEENNSDNRALSESKGNESDNKINTQDERDASTNESRINQTHEEEGVNGSDDPSEDSDREMDVDEEADNVEDNDDYENDEEDESITQGNHGNAKEIGESDVDEQSVNEEDEQSDNNEESESEELIVEREVKVAQSAKQAEPTTPQRQPRSRPNHPVMINQQSNAFNHKNNNSSIVSSNRAYTANGNTKKTSKLANYYRYRTKDQEIKLEIESLEETFSSLIDHYFLLDKIGQGTFSSVYKGVDLQYRKVKNQWEEAYNNTMNYSNQTSKKVNIVAIKRIYVTSSPARIANEIEILKCLTSCPNIIPVITALRHRDQVLVVFPYFSHTDFRVFYSEVSISGIRRYMYQLLNGLNFVHENGIIHRDVKPTNFLYDAKRRRGVLVDFGLAEFLPKEDNAGCSCVTGGLDPSVYLNVVPQGGYKKDDPRHGRRANRAGTRGFRAPEVLLKCAAQDTKLDIWSAGVILLTLLSKRFPFFNSDDDAEALIEIATMFGCKKMQKCAFLHGSMFETDIPTIHDEGFSLSRIIEWCLGKKSSKSSNGADESRSSFSKDELEAIDLLEHMMELDYRKRYSASECLADPFFSGRM
ncbi:serine/threonine protein kinase CDC7 [Sugiyamaella lignohabitans]|uniref:non-specific serine/threonine protein kinase n=1 Tax=Sugiyamaella lignohabitans TaxID=796027 RepID=A0A167CGD1_9ASCO|nr:serine/threonine protein kinase CDC7 [Sugiyamaella lignohabitans]ANB11653.1 serine/threonine protein kinase CDC7 [Sugiyamaella lignohabitans]